MNQQVGKEEGSLSFNRSSGLYEGTIRIGVDAELFRRRLLRAIEEDENADLSDPRELANIITQVGKTSSWLNNPHTRVLHDPPFPAALLPKVKEKEPIPGTISEIKTKIGTLREMLREKARYVAPHLWEEQCLTPHDPSIVERKSKQQTSNHRHEERVILQKLRTEWEAGTFILDAEAAAEEERYQEEQSDKLTQKLEVVAMAVNSNGFH